MDYILSLSYGKDSLACLGAIQELGWPLTRIVHAEVWATDTIPADLPPMVDFKEKADRIIYDLCGIKVERVSAGVTFDEAFHFMRGRTGRKSKHAGTIYGWPMVRGQWCLQQLKLPALKRVFGDAVQYLGISYDEPSRFNNLSSVKVSPLVALQWTEKQCFDWCKSHDLLSPIYTHSARGGCWFCHNQSNDQLRYLRKNYPEYWKLMLQWDSESATTFRSDGHTLLDLENRFSLEDEGLIYPDEPFHWRQLHEELNYRWF